MTTEDFIENINNSTCKLLAKKEGVYIQGRFIHYSLILKENIEFDRIIPSFHIKEELIDELKKGYAVIFYDSGVNNIYDTGSISLLLQRLKLEGIDCFALPHTEIIYNGYQFGFCKDTANKVEKNIGFKVFNKASGTITPQLKTIVYEKTKSVFNGRNLISKEKNQNVEFVGNNKSTEENLDSLSREEITTFLNR